MVLFSSSCARLTQIQMKANRLKTSWALGTVLRASTTEPLLRGRAVLSQQSYCFQLVIAILEKSAFKEKTNRTPIHVYCTPSHGGTGAIDLRCHQMWHWPSCAAPHRPVIHLASCSTCHGAQRDAARHSLALGRLVFLHLEWFTLLFAFTSPCNR